MKAWLTPHTFDRYPELNVPKGIDAVIRSHDKVECESERLNEQVGVRALIHPNGGNLYESLRLTRPKYCVD